MKKSPRMLPKAYDPQSVEAALYRSWERGGYFRPQPHPSAKKTRPFVISLPPPNATGTLHLGHATMLAVEDLMIRYHRLRGDETLWVPGTDHAAIATQNVVEKTLWQEERKTRHDLGREAFLERVAAFVKESQGTIKRQMRRMGASVDWSRERYTMDAGLSRAVRLVFKIMHDDGLIYRGSRIVNWCPRCQTTLADDEVEYQAEAAPFYRFRFGPFSIGTVRPETKLGDKYVVVHPDDKRYRRYHGLTKRIPWIDGEVEMRVIADVAADPRVGSGAMTITPQHDFTDFDIAQRHGLDIGDNIIGTDGRLTGRAGKFAGLPVREAREQFVKILRDKGLVEKIDDDYVHNVSICYRCETPIEPLVSPQWFVAVNKPTARLGGKTLRQRAREAVAGGEIEIIPHRFMKTYLHWMDNLRDWCVSRQIWFGHRIPVWYCGRPPKPDEQVMGFAESVIPRVQQGMTTTYRLRDRGLAPGDAVSFVNSRSGLVFGYGTITAVERVMVKDIQLHDERHRTRYRSRRELIAAFKRHHPERGVTTNTPAFLYSYRFTPASARGEGCGDLVVAAGPRPLTRCPSCGSRKLTQDPDTLDTWFSSGLWTFSTLLKQDSDAATLEAWRAESPDLKRYHPTSVLETGYDILFFWIARMVLMTTYALKQIPFRTVYLHGLVRDKEGRKMSKSLGNGIDPVDMIERYGADAVRLSLVVGATPGNDLRLYEEKIAGYRNFVNKLWNISRFIITTTKPTAAQPRAQTLADRWIIAEFGSLVRTVTDHLDAYRFSAAGEALYEFTWRKLADWYLEVAKVEGGKDGLLRHLLTDLLILWHPFTPFVTEHIWKLLTSSEGKLRTDRRRPDAKPLIVAAWPTPTRPASTGREFTVIQSVVGAIRDLRQEIGAPIGTPVYVATRWAKLLQRERAIVDGLSRATLHLEQTPARPAIANVAKRVLPGITIYMAKAVAAPTGNTKDDRERWGLEAYIAALKSRLANREFVSRAPAIVVAKEKQRLKDAEERLRRT